MATREIQAVLDAVADLKDTRDPGDMANLDALVGAVRLSQLPMLEFTIREAYLKAYAWSHLTLKSVKASQYPLNVWGLISMNRCGFVREHALRELANLSSSSRSLGFMLVRVNDWVNQVRSFAADVVRSYLRAERVDTWIPALGLVAILADRTRVDHEWLFQAVQSLFNHPVNHEHVLTALRDTDPHVRRWAARSGLPASHTPRRDVIEVGLRSPDPVVRVYATRAACDWPDPGERIAFGEQMWNDCYAPIRRLAMYITVDQGREAATPRLIAALHDRHRSIRRAARYYLSQFDPSFDPAPFYREALKTRPTAATVAGLGECGVPADARALKPYVQHERPRVAAAAVGAIAQLDRKGRTAWFEDWITDARPGVARAAAAALVEEPGSVDVPRLRRHMLTASQPLSRRLAFRVLTQRDPYDAIIDVLEAAASNDERLREQAREFIRRACYLIRYMASAAQREAAVEALASLGGRLPDDIVRETRCFMGLPYQRRTDTG